MYHFSPALDASNSVTTSPAHAATPPPPLKRKRSVSELSSPPCSSSPASGPSHLSSRTLKRFRDSRPPEAELHRNTLNLLFSAQRSAASPPSSPSPPPPPQTALVPRRYLPSQPSLHRFWAGLGPAPLTPAAAAATPSPPVSATGPCDDCGSTGPDADPDAMDLDGAVPLHPCVDCGRRVCFACSVSNLGDDPRCLRCARDGRVWGRSGVGWASPVVAY